MEKAYYYMPEDNPNPYRVRRGNSKRPSEKMTKKNNFGAIFIIIFVIVAVLAIFKVSKEEVVESGKIVYDESLTEYEKTKIESLVKENGDETKDIIFSASETDNLNNLPKENGETSVAIEVYVPTVDFYSSKLNISSAELPNIVNSAKNFDNLGQKSSTRNQDSDSNNLASSSSTSGQESEYTEDTTTSNSTSQQSISGSTAQQTKGGVTVNEITLINLNDLTSETRVVSVDNNYYFDNPKLGAKFRVIKVKSASEKLREKYAEGLKKVFGEVPENSSDFLSFAQTGVTAITRAMTTALNGKAGGRGSYFADKIKDFLSSKDLTHISNEISFDDNCKGGTNTVSLCADWRALDSITAIGTDIIELTGNHNNDYSMKDNIATINKYKEMNFKTFGGGLNEEEAAKPLELDEKGQKITMLGYNYSTSTKANGQLADGDNPGANGYTEDKAKSDISAAKARGDFVVVDIQYSECYSYPDGYTEMPSCDAPISGQQSFFRQLIDFGADMVVGTQAHQPQTFEYYNGKPIYYGLGNLFFDQTYWPGTQRGIILTHYFKNGKLLNTRLNPTWYDENYQVYLLDQSDSESFLARLINSSPRGE